MAPAPETVAFDDVSVAMRDSEKTPSRTEASEVLMQKKRAHSVALGSGGIPEPAEVIAVKFRMTAVLDVLFGFDPLV